MTKKINKNGAVFYEGPSLIDPTKKVVGIMTGLQHRSQNKKTDDLIQTFVLPTDSHPIEARKTNNHNHFCGDCIHVANDTCYVDWGKAPSQVWGCYKRGNYARFDPYIHGQYLRGRMMRCGSAGEPTAVPIDVWDNLLQSSRIRSHTGYTHRWRICDQDYRHLFLASCDTPEDTVEAMDMGWRFFFAGPIPWVTEVNKNGSLLCESQVSTCADCSNPCNPQSKVTRGVTIPVHGTPYKVKRYYKVLVPMLQQKRKLQQSATR